MKGIKEELVKFPQSPKRLQRIDKKKPRFLLPVEHHKEYHP